MTITELAKQPEYCTWWHKKGYYQVVVTACKKDDNGNLWVSFFITKNCDYTLRKFDGAFLRQDENTPAADIVYESWFNDTSIKVNSGKRFLDTFVKEKPDEILEPKIIETQDVVRFIEIEPES